MRQQTRACGALMRRGARSVALHEHAKGRSAPRPNARAYARFPGSDASSSADALAGRGIFVFGGASVGLRSQTKMDFNEITA